MTNNDCAVILLNYNNFDDSEECIKSLLNSGEELDIIFVDNRSPDGSGERIRQEFKQEIIYIDAGQNGGFSKGNNVGIRYCLDRGYEYIHLLATTRLSTQVFYFH